MSGKAPLKRVRTDDHEAMASLLRSAGWGRADASRSTHSRSLDLQRMRRSNLETYMARHNITGSLRLSAASATRPVPLWVRGKVNLQEL